MSNINKCEHKWKELVGEPVELTLEYGFVEGTLEYDEAQPKSSKCDCGAEVAKTTHSHWCSKETK